MLLCEEQVIMQIKTIYICIRRSFSLTNIVTALTFLEEIYQFYCRKVVWCASFSLRGAGVRSYAGELALLMVTSHTPVKIRAMAMPLRGVKVSRPRQMPVIVATMGCT